jgi:hypothetical protein
MAAVWWVWSKVQVIHSVNSGMARNRTMGLRPVLNRDIDNLKSRIARARWRLSHDQFQGCCRAYTR